MFAELKECFMEAYDDNRDGKIEIREVSVTHLTVFWNPSVCMLAGNNPKRIFLKERFLRNVSQGMILNE